MLARLRAEPAAFWTTGLGTLAALVVAFAHLDATQAGIVAGLAVAVGSIITALETRPIEVPVIAGAAGVILQSLVIFNVDLSSAQIAAVVQVISLGLGLVAMRPNISPVASRPASQRPVSAVKDPA